MNYYEERKKAFFANENIDSSMASIKKNITLRKKDLREKIFLKRLNYSNSIQTTNIFELNPASLKLTDEEKNFIITEMVHKIFIIPNILNNFINHFNSLLTSE